MNKVVLVTGASRGLGSSIAKKFLESGDIVYINYKSTSLKELEKKYAKEPKAHFLFGDVSKEEDVIKMMQIIKEEQGKLDVLVNNAAISIDSELEDKTVANFKQILDVNLIGPFLTCKYAKDIMAKGSIINISSTNAIDTPEAYSLDYDASKAGLISLTHNFAKIYGPDIRVNAIASGWINTSNVLEMEPHYIEKEKSKIILNRFAEPEEIANVVFFLASKEASYIVDSILRVDGGLK